MENGDMVSESIKEETQLARISSKVFDYFLFGI